MMSKTMAAAMLVLASFGATAANEKGQAGTDSALSDNYQISNKINIDQKRDILLKTFSAKNQLLADPKLLVEKRLSLLEKAVPLTYNQYVQHYIDLYAEKAKGKIGRALGLAPYYFPIYEEAFAKKNIPEEIKYLSIVESALNPYAVSRVGATGLWQFMYTTGKMYNLTINHWLDERRDPVAASAAAAEYLNDAYEQFGDWLLAIASYNCGSGNVRRAIARAGGSYDFWAIRPYLPRETQNYIPAYIATTYLMHYHENYDISPIAADFNIKTEILQVSSKVSLASIAKAIDVDVQELAQLNPSYLKQIIYGSAAAPRPLVIPEIEHSYYNALYHALHIYPDKEPEVLTASYVKKPAAKEGPVYYEVRKGDNLSSIAKKFEVEVQDLRVWNAIKQGVIVPGQVLRVSATDAAKLHVSEYITYKVQPGDTLLKIAQKFKGVTVSGLKTVNKLKDTAVKPGILLKIVKG